MELGLNRAKGCPLGYCPGIKRGTKVVLQELDMHIAQTLALRDAPQTKKRENVGT